MAFELKATLLGCLLLLILCNCGPRINQAVENRVLVFGTFSGFENNKDAVHTPTKDFGWFAKPVTIGFDDISQFSGPLSVPIVKTKVSQSGFFSMALPAGEYNIFIGMPNRQVNLEHSFLALEPDKAYYLGHIDLKILRRNIFFLIGACSYGKIESFSVSDKLSETKHWFDAKHPYDAKRTIENSIPVPVKGKQPFIVYDCGFLE